uniref:Rhamnogalacturonase A/B/Epimerase-like pectate lyase domain-containing protein n=1 Tax=Magnetococcus massalia (strain MO-1) TaxID=451514 RepID=A0A1S7LG39_MAGMO|nr:protein of unknown function [Candidatus Magnetococcus massalia]
MARDGNGTHNRLYDWTDEASAGNPISSVKVDAEMDDMANEISNSLAKDGQTLPTANLSMGGFRHIDVAAAQSRDEYATAAQLQDGTLHFGSDMGSGDAYAISVVPAPVGYSPGQTFRFVASHENSGPATFEVNGLGAVEIKKHGDLDLAQQDIRVGSLLTLTYDGTLFQLTSVAYTDARSSQFDVRFYGAAGDGVTDDSSAFQAAIDAAAITGGTVIARSTSSGYLVGGLQMREGVHLKGDGHTLLKGSGAQPIFIFDAMPNGPGGLWDLSIEPGGETSSCIQILKGRNLRFDNLHLGFSTTTGNIAHGIHIQTASDGGGAYFNHFNRIRIANLQGNGIQLITEDGQSLPKVNANTFSGIIVDSCGGHGLLLRGAAGNWFEGTIENCGGYGVLFEDNAGAAPPKGNSLNIWMEHNSSGDISAPSTGATNNQFFFRNAVNMDQAWRVTDGNVWQNGSFLYTANGLSTSGYFTIKEQGKTESTTQMSRWGGFQMGDGDTSPDCNLYRTDVDSWKTDDTLVLCDQRSAVESGGVISLGRGNSHLFNFSGNITITGIASADTLNGRVLYLRVVQDGTGTITLQKSTGNLRLPADITITTGQARNIILICTGASWQCFGNQLVNP